MSEEITIKVGMVGPSRVGKTSFIASMHNRINDDAMKLGFSFSANNSQTRNTCIDSLEALKKMASKDGTVIDVSMGPDPTVGVKNFNFKLYKPKLDEFPELHFKFTDIPGGWYKTGQSEAENLLKESDILLLAVDSVALMEEDGKYNDARGNDSARIVESITPALSRRPAGTPPPFVIIVATKAETYLRNSALSNAASSKTARGRKELGEKELRAKIKETYEGLGILKQASIEVKGCAVETVGNIVLNHIREDERGNPTFSFRRIPGMNYSPRYCSLPMRIILKKVLERAHENIGEPSIIDWLFTKMGYRTDKEKVREELKKLLEKLSNSTSHGSSIEELVFDVI